MTLTHNRSFVFLAAAVFSLTTTVAGAQTTEPQSNALPTTRRVPVADVAGTGTTNQVPRWTDGAGTLGDSNLYSDPALGRIGIGTTTPTGQLHIFGTASQDVFAGMGTDLAAGPAFNFGYAGASFGIGAGFFNVRPHASAVAPNPSLRFATANVQRMIITNVGNIGIGTTAPAYVLDVVGTGHFTGNVTVDGNLAAKYQDVAEWVPSDTELAGGTVVVINSDKKNEVTPSARSYDTRIAGVVSEEPGISLGVAGAGKYKIATLGRVRVKVDASKAPIAAGDLLVTSDVPGMAMKSMPVSIGGIEIHKPGTLLGKALEPLASGKGEILVLLTLQ
jgi:hypothetical protein